MPGRFTALALVTLTACHLSHERSTPDADAPASGDGAAVGCDEGKLRTSGMAEPFAAGNRCEFLVVCSSEYVAGRLEEEIVVRFPSMTCSGRPDGACDGDAVSSCIAYLGTLDEDQYSTGCELTLMDEVTSLVCAGDI